MTEWTTETPTEAGAYLIRKATNPSRTERVRVFDDRSGIPRDDSSLEPGEMEWPSVEFDDDPIEQELGWKEAFPIHTIAGPTTEWQALAIWTTNAPTAAGTYLIRRIDRPALTYPTVEGMGERVDVYDDAKGDEGYPHIWTDPDPNVMERPMVEFFNEVGYAHPFELNEIVGPKTEWLKCS